MKYIIDLEKVKVDELTIEVEASSAEQALDGVFQYIESFNSTKRTENIKLRLLRMRKE